MHIMHTFPAAIYNPPGTWATAKWHFIIIFIVMRDSIKLSPVSDDWAALSHLFASRNSKIQYSIQIANLFIRVRGSRQALS